MVSPPYQVAVRLSACAAFNWPRIDGRYTGQGIDLFHLPFSRFLSVIYAWAIERMNKEEAEKWEAMLTAPLSGSDEGDEDDFITGASVITAEGSVY
jgi:hypothetical protein